MLPNHYTPKQNYQNYDFNLLFRTRDFFIFLIPRRADERYHIRFADGEFDDIDDCEPFVTYQQRKKPYTRRKYADAIKIVYEGEEDYDYASEQPQRYR